MAIQPVTMNKIASVAPASLAANTSASENTKEIQSQISTKQQHLKKVSSDDSITATEKEEKRRQLQKEIDDLNRELERKKQEQEEKAKEAAKKQEQAEARKAEMQKKAMTSVDSKEDSARISSKEA
ncbi:MAG: FlxA-like family protein, partial [Roseburia sp.]|nr:FlxA-like family protein [Roseburia sp.]